MSIPSNLSGILTDPEIPQENMCDTNEQMTIQQKQCKGKGEDLRNQILLVFQMLIIQDRKKIYMNKWMKATFKC